MKTTSASRLRLSLIASALFAGGCASSAMPSTVGKSEPREQARSLEGVHAERIALKTDDAKQVEGVLHGVLQLGRDGMSEDIRAVFLERSTNELVVIGTDRGVARVRALLSPALIATDVVAPTATQPTEAPPTPAAPAAPTDGATEPTASTP